VNQFFATLAKNGTLQLALIAAGCLLAMAMYAAAQKFKRKRAQKAKLQANTRSLTAEATKLLEVNAASSLEDRRQLQKELDSFRKHSTDLGMDPDAFITPDQQNRMRQIARTAKEDLGLSDDHTTLPSDAHILTVFGAERDTEITDKNPEMPEEEPTGRFDRTLIDDDCPTQPFDRNSISTPAKATASTPAIDAQFDQLMTYSEDPEGVISIEDLDEAKI